MSKPRHQHDCPRCTFLGVYDVRNREIDLYHCIQLGNMPTLIARYSSTPDDYAAGIAFANVLPEIKEAKERALAKNLPLTV